MILINIHSSEAIEIALAILKRHWLILAFIIVTVKVFQSRWFHPLSKFPGPFLGSVTYWYSVYVFFTYRAHELEYDLNKKYGMWTLTTVEARIFEYINNYRLCLSASTKHAFLQ